MKRRSVAAAVTAAAGLPLLAAVVVMAGRVGEPARFVTWPVVGFAAAASLLAVVGLVIGSSRPWLLAAGVVPAVVVSYFLPALPLGVLAVVLLLLGGLAVRVRGVAAGMAAVTGSLMVLYVVLQGPAVSCRQGGASSSSGPGWIRSSDTASGSGVATADGRVAGTTQIGGHHYAYACDGRRLTMFERVDPR